MAFGVGLLILPGRKMRIAFFMIIGRDNGGIYGDGVGGGVFLWTLSATG
jgi:hypothetical protein